MFWRTGCIGCGPTCGGRRRRSEPERAGGEQAGALGLLPRRRGWLERPRSRWRPGPPRPGPVPAKLEAALPVDRAKPKTPGVERAVPVTTTGHCPVPVLPRRAKTSFPGRGPLRYAPWSFPPGVGKLAGPVPTRQRQSSRRCLSGPRSPRGIVRSHEPCSTGHYG